MKKCTVFTGILLALLTFWNDGNAAENLFIYHRNTTPLNGAWNYIVDPYENGFYDYRLVPFDERTDPWVAGYYLDKQMQDPGDLIEYNFDKSPTLQVPGDWNTQDQKLYYYEGTVWYRKKFDAPAANAGDRIFLYFCAANYRADVYLNGEKLGMHIGGFTPFWFEITGKLKPSGNSLVVKVDNKRLRGGVPTINTDWWNYGGLTRSVELLTVPTTFIRDYRIQLDDHNTKIVSGEVYLEGAQGGEEITVRFPQLKKSIQTTADEKGHAAFRLKLPKAGLWHPEDPVLYRIELESALDRLIDTVGLRTITTQGKEVLLNGEPIFLRGISVHEEYAADGGGRVTTPAGAAQLLDWALDLGCNFVRLAHYPHNEDMVRIAEKKGILVWSEIPVYWTISWDNPETWANAARQLEENILRDRNRASVIIWSVANETPVSKSRTEFLTRLVDHTRSLDGSRMVSAALEKHYKSDSIAVVEDPMAEVLDIVAFNQYIGWYDGLPEKCTRVSWEIPYDKPVFISEFGGGAKYGYNGSSDDRWTEEFQEDLYRKSIPMLESIDGLCGMSPWILVDFRSPRRPLPEIQDEFNRKGLLSEKGEKKRAFVVLQEYYQKVQSTK